jgi:hypothetical protein
VKELKKAPSRFRLKVKASDANRGKKQKRENVVHRDNFLDTMNFV